MLSSIVVRVPVKQCHRGPGGFPRRSHPVEPMALAGGWLNVVEQNEWKCLLGSWLEHLGRCSATSRDGADAVRVKPGSRRQPRAPC